MSEIEIPRRIFFAGFRPPTDDEIAWLAKSGCELVILGLDDEDDDRRGVDPTDYADTWELRAPWRNGKLEQAIDKLHAAGLLVGVHYWLRPVRKWLDGAHGFLRDLLITHDLFVVMGDFERHGLRMDPVKGGFTSWEDFVDFLEREWQEPPSSAPWDTRWPLYSLAVYGWQGKRSGWLAEMVTVAFVVLMVYGDRAHAGSTSEALALYRSCWRQWSADVDVGAEIVMGCGTYGQARVEENVSGPSFMARTHELLTAEGCHHRAFWSLPNCRTAPYRAAVEAVFADLEI